MRNYRDNILKGENEKNIISSLQDLFCIPHQFYEVHVMWHGNTSLNAQWADLSFEARIIPCNSKDWALEKTPKISDKTTNYF